MANVLNRTTKEYLRSVNTPDYPDVDWIKNPDVSALAGVPTKYWNISGDTVTEMSQGEKDAVDAADQAARVAAIKAEIKERFDRENDNTKAIGLLMLELYQLLRSEIKSGALNSPLPDITPAQLKTRYRNIVDNL